MDSVQKNQGSVMGKDLDALIQSVPGVVYLFCVSADGHMSFPYLSDGITGLYEISSQAACAAPSLMADCIIEDDRERHFQSIRQSMEHLSPWVHEFRIRTPSGLQKWIRGQSTPSLQGDGSVLWSGILTDVSQLKETEANLLRLQRLLASANEVNRLISRTHSQDELFQGICKIAVEQGHMKMAWIGAPNESGEHLEALARFGQGAEILDEAVFFARLDLAEERGQAASAFVESRTVLNQDFLQNPNTMRWRELAQRFGFGSSASIPLCNQNRTVGVLTVYRHESNAFDEESVTLLERLSSDIGHALEKIANVEERKRLEEALRFRQFGLDNVDEEIFWIDQAGKICDVNETACRMLGYTREELLRLEILEIDPNCTVTKWQEHWQALKQRKILRFDSSQKNKDGLICPTEVIANYFEYQGKEYNCVLVRNITERKIMEEALAESRERFALFMDTLPAAAFIKDREGTTIYANRYLSEIVGGENWQGKSTSDLFPVALASKMVADDLRALEEGYLVTEEQIPSKDGQLRTYQTHKFRISRHDQEPLLGGIALDISERKQMEETILNLAYYDALTNLPNRRMLVDRLDQALSRAKRNKNSLAVMFLDLDRFKIINDSLGHHVGDELLKEVAVRLKECVRSSDTVSRHGGDEFIILLPEINLPEDAIAVSEKIIKAVSMPAQIGEHVLSTSVSIGITIFTRDSEDSAHALLKKADSAMYAAKEAGRNRFVIDVA